MPGRAAPIAAGMPASNGTGIVLVAFLGGFALNPALVALGSLFDTLHGSYGWNRAQVTTAQLIFTVVSLAGVPAIGPLLDRHGPRRLLLVGLALVPVPLALLGATNGSYARWVGGWILLSIVGQLVTPPMFAAGVVRHFERRRGLALGVAACGLALANMVAPVLMVRLAAAGLWRVFFLGLAVFLPVVLLPLTFLFYRPGGVNAAPPAGQRDATPGSWRELLRQARYWRLFAIVLLTAAVVGGLLIHLQPLLRARGLSPAAAALAMAWYGIGGVVGRIGGGWLLDRFARRPWAALPMGLFPTLAAALLLLDRGPSVAVGGAIALLIGIAAGVEVDVIPFLVRRFFAAPLFGRAYVSLFAAFVTGMGLAPFAVGLLYDATGTYADVLVAAIPMGAAATLLLLLLGPYPPSSTANG